MFKISIYLKFYKTEFKDRKNSTITDPMRGIKLENFESPEIRKAKKEEENPLRRKFGEIDQSLENGFNSLFDFSKFQKVQDELLSKLKNELFMGINKPEEKNLITMHVEKVPVSKE